MMKKLSPAGLLPTGGGLDSHESPSAERTPSPSPRKFSFASAQAAIRKASLPSISIFPEKATSAPPVADPHSIAPLTHRENTPLHALRNTATVTTSRPAVLRRSSEHEGINRLGGHVFLLGGYRGSVLRDARSGKRLWAPLAAAVGYREVNLELGLSDADELRSEEAIVAEKALTTVMGVVEMGRALKTKLKALEATGQIVLHNWGYDWRRGLALSSAKLLEAVERASEESGGEGVTVIAHSMGGLVALHAMARAARPQVFRRILFAGTPFEGCPNALGPLRLGDVLGRNPNICSPKAVFSMRATFYMLPPPEKLQIFETSNGKAIFTDLFSLEHWSRYGFSPLARDVLHPGSVTRAVALQDAAHAVVPSDEAGSPVTPDDPDDPELLPIAPSLSSKSPSIRSGRRFSTFSAASPILPPTPAVVEDDSDIAAYLQRTLDRVQRFHADLTSLYDPAKAHLYPALGLIASNATPTVRGVRVDTEDDIAAGDFSRLLFDHGDGIVLHSSATALPTPWRAHLRTTEMSSFGHVSLLSDLATVDRALEKIC